MSQSERFWFGILGGVIAEMLAVYQFRSIPKAERPAFLKDWFYWLLAPVTVVLGGILACTTLPVHQHLMQWVPIQAGLTAPLVWSGVWKGTGDLGAGSHD